MNTLWQRFIIFCFIGLPIEWETAKRYWWAVILWVGLLFGLNILLYDQMMQFKNTLDEMVNSGSM